MNKAQVAVVRHVPDPVRDEPRNVGVIVVGGGQGVAHFLGEDVGGKLNLKRVKGAIEHRAAYRDWVNFWRGALADGSLDDPVAQRTVGISEGTSFLEALARMTSGNYQVRLGGEMIYGHGLSLDHALSEVYERVVGGVPAQASSTERRVSHRTVAQTAYRGLRKQLEEGRDFVRDLHLFGSTQSGKLIPAVFDFGLIPEGEQDKPEDERSLLLVDAISLYVADAEADVIDRARVVAAKAMEIRQSRPDVHVRAVTSNANSAESKTGRYALDVLKAEGGVGAITVKELLQLAPRVLQGEFL